MGKCTFTKKFLPLALTAAMVLPTVPAMAAASDISGHWAEKVITEWQDKGLIKGYSDGTFKPGNNITRAEFVTLMNNAKGYVSEANITFTDVKTGDWFYSAVAKAAAAGYTKGYSDGSFQPGKTITRAEAAVMIANAAGLSADESSANKFTDAASIPAWAKGSVGAVVAAGFMSGYPDGSFGANASITRAEAVSSLDRAINGAAAEDENMVVEEAGTVVENGTVEGDLTISETVGEGDVTIKDVEIKGDLIVNGGGANSIHLENVKVGGRVLMQKENVRLHLLGSTDISTLVMNQPGRITKDSSFDGKIGRITIAPDRAFDKDVRIEVPAGRIQIENRVNLILGADADTITVGEDATGATITINAKVKVGTLTVDAKITIKGSGEIATLEINIAGVTISKSLTIGETVVDKDAEAPKIIEESSNGGGGGGSGSGSSSADKKKVTGIVAVDGIEVAYGTSEADALAKLPAKVELTLKKGANIEADVAWAVKAGETYVATAAETTVTVVGTVTIPSGYRFSGNPTTETTITVLKEGQTPADEDIKVVGVAAQPQGIEVDLNAAAADVQAKLAQKVTLMVEKDGKTVTGPEAALTWDVSKVDTSKAGTYTATATVTIPTGYTYSGTLTVSAEVVVKDGTAATTDVDFTITPATKEVRSLIGTGEEFTLNLVGGTVDESKVTVQTSHADLEVDVAIGGTSVMLTNVPTTAGEYTVDITIPAAAWTVDADYNAVDVTKSFTITVVEPRISDSEITATGSEITVVLKGEYLWGQPVQVYLTEQSGTPSVVLLDTVAGDDTMITVPTYDCSQMTDGTYWLTYGFGAFGGYDETKEIVLTSGVPKVNNV